MDELYYKHVMVDPELTEDPIRAQGKIGRIDVISYADDEVGVMFDENYYGLYEADALLVLKPGDVLLQEIKNGLHAIDKSDLLQLLNIYLMQQSRKPEMITEALQLAMSNEVIRANSIISLRNWIDHGLTDNYNYGADFKPGR